MKTLNNKYELGNILLGSGGFSEVYLGTHIATKQTVAIKKVNLHQNDLSEQQVLEKLKFETQIMQNLQHPNIVNFYDVVKTSKSWFIIMEYCNIGTLEDVIKYNEQMSKKKSINFSREGNTFYYLNQLKDALAYIRKRGYIHRDIKPANVLLVTSMPLDEKVSDNAFLIDSGLLFKSHEQLDNQSFETKFEEFDKEEPNYSWEEKIVVKLADFGLAKSYAENDSSMMNTMCGSPLYMAPELLLKQKYNSKADLWSFGIIMYQMLFGVRPNEPKTIQQLIQNIKSKKIDFHLNKNFTPSCFDLITKLLDKDSESRINWNNFFNHEWFTYWENQNGDYNKIYMQENRMDPPTGSLAIKESIFTHSKPIQINTDNKIKNSVDNLSPLGSSNLSKMRAGYTGSTDTKYYPYGNRALGSYEDYPASYAASDPRRLSYGSSYGSPVGFSSDKKLQNPTNNIKTSSIKISNTNPLNVSIPFGNSRNVDMNFSRSCGTPNFPHDTIPNMTDLIVSKSYTPPSNCINNSRNRIFKNSFCDINGKAF